MASVHGQYSKLPLSEFTEKLRIEYYESIERLCVDVYEQVEKIKMLDPAKMNFGYLAQCHSVLENAKRTLVDRRERHIPYLQSLTEKVDSNHNCAGCTGNCKLNHDIQLFDISVAAKHLKNIQNDLQLLSLPLYAETIYPDQYRILRNLLALIESDMVELFFLEENYLIPKVVEAQKTINVFSR